ncbi:MAG: hypothetical protein AB7E51_15950 [Pseudodesulfovibrio sp.]|uniref:DUF202 domain-containing protein n=1 Tax=Pseudodesulfovibrio indicus TaxID=1716143 RepID=A0A126QKW3_9BACT|nr:hypothetical protein [Pseudodesulfovibrio indicus]AMK10601.1 hypothetical protein AWY79_05465 [Pseudodesulfovibrio indicus]TDT82727.1 hypothetical protein EDC59_11639 [Pseudodesulfovibrio indicus]
MSEKRKPRKATPAIEAKVRESLRVAANDRATRQTHLQAFAAVLTAAALAIVGLVGGLFKPAPQTAAYVRWACYASLFLLLSSVMVSLVVLRPRYGLTSLKQSTDNPYERHIREEAIFFKRQRLLTYAYRLLCCGILLGVLALVLQ